MEAFNRVWARVREAYESGYILYERGLQAAMYEALRKEFPERRFVVEPHWGEQEHRKIPDMVVVSRREISDILELKFQPHRKLPLEEIENTIANLLEYEGEQHVMLDPPAGQWADPLPIRGDCRRHLVIVARADSPTVLPRYIPDQIIHWYGRVAPDPEQREWEVCQGRLMLD